MASIVRRVERRSYLGGWGLVLVQVLEEGLRLGIMLGEVVPSEVFVCGKVGYVFEFELVGTQRANDVRPAAFVYCGSDS
jgi:hypothetical protein